MSLTPGYYERNPTKWLIRYVAYYASYEGLMKIPMTPGRSFYQEAWSHFVIGIKHMYGLSTFREAASKAKEVCEETPLTIDPITLWQELPRTKREEEDARYPPTDIKLAWLAEKLQETPCAIQAELQKEYTLTKEAFDTTLNDLYESLGQTSTLSSTLLYIKYEPAIQKLGDLTSSLIALGEHLGAGPCPMVVNAVRSTQASLKKAKEESAALAEQLRQQETNRKRRKLEAVCDERPQRIEASTATRRIPLL